MPTTREETHVANFKSWIDQEAKKDATFPFKRAEVEEFLSDLTLYGRDGSLK